MNTHTTNTDGPLDRLRHHVSGAVERGEAEPITEVPAAPDMHDYGFRAATDVTPGIDYLFLPYLENSDLPAHQQVYVKVLASTVTPSGRVTFLLELPSGRTFERTVPAHRHMTVFYRGRQVVR